MATTGDLSVRARSNVELVMPILRKMIEEKKHALDTAIDLSTAENWLIRNELLHIYKTALAENITPRQLSYPDGFMFGDSSLLGALATLFNTYFKPRIPVEPSHIALASGAAGSLDALIYSICDPGDTVLVPGPYWTAFDLVFYLRSSVTPIAVTVGSLAETMTHDLIPALSKAFDESTKPVKGVILTNPHNPIGQCYPRSVIEACVRFCQERKIHFISDEVYALSVYPSSDLPDPVPFTSVLELDTKAMGCDLSRIHTVWGTSKDLGSSGIRVGITVSQGDQAITAAVALAGNMMMPSFSAIATTALLKSPRLPDLIRLNSERLGEAYKMVTSFFKRHGIEYIPANAGLFILAKLAPEAKTWEDEAKTVKTLNDAGVLVSPGKTIHVSEKGWVRMIFAVDPSVLKEALRRIETGLQLSHVSITNDLVDLQIDKQQGQPEGVVSFEKATALQSTADTA
ncbi:MAG: hypothetical protein M1816_002034 [Peltula sp. TS41687]|nr:MAG: hypothetical protein M1816_002034 [Peltula sp. TS41687]